MEYTADIWLKVVVSSPLATKTSQPRRLLQVHHDEDAEIYLNGVLAVQLPGFDTIYQDQKINPAVLAALQPGANLIAVHCHQTTGGQFIDAGIVIPLTSKPLEPVSPEAKK